MNTKQIIKLRKDFTVADTPFIYGMMVPVQIMEISKAYQIARKFAICTTSVQGFTMVLRSMYVVIGREVQ